MHPRRKNKRSSFIPLIAGLLICSALLTVAVAWKGNLYLSAAALAVFIASAVWTAVVLRRGALHSRRFLASFEKGLSRSNSTLLNRFSLPVLVLREFEEIKWYNASFLNVVLHGRDLFDSSPSILLEKTAVAALTETGQTEITYSGRSFSVYCGEYEQDGEQYRVLFFSDITKYQQLSDRYEAARPAVALLSIDSLDEIMGDSPDSEKAAMQGIIEREIERWTAGTNGFLRKLSDRRYLVVMDEQSLHILTDGRFAVLDRVRAISHDGHTGATLSIGVGHGGQTVGDCEAMARQALEMALGRGGDQAAVKNGNAFSFYGGATSVAVEKRTKVRTRVIASALKELIRGSDNVFIMGHRFSDLDSVGAAFGIWRAVCDSGRTGYIVMEKDKTLAPLLVQRITAQELGGAILSPEDAAPMITRRSLLIVVDTHRAQFLDAPQIYHSCQTVVVIDHHRKTVDYIENAVIFYHEPYASSACEMVAELLQYMSCEVGKLEAEALLAGIMLDTRNFVLRTGVRTFEASAYLRSRGADPVEVKKMFADTMDVYRERSALVSAAEFYGKCAISLDRSGKEVSRIAASQAADELLGIENVDASFVIFRSSDGINISARSLGAVNVQLIMEQLGGGGHLTMAAAQLPNATEDEAKNRLIEAIEQCRADGNAHGSLKTSMKKEIRDEREETK